MAGKKPDTLDANESGIWVDFGQLPLYPGVVIASTLGRFEELLVEVATLQNVERESFLAVNSHRTGAFRRLHLENKGMDQLLHIEIALASLHSDLMHQISRLRDEYPELKQNEDGVHYQPLGGFLPSRCITNSSQKNGFRYRS